MLSEAAKENKVYLVGGKVPVAAQTHARVQTGTADLEKMEGETNSTLHLRIEMSFQPEALTDGSG